MLFRHADRKPEPDQLPGIVDGVWDGKMTEVLTVMSSVGYVLAPAGTVIVDVPMVLVLVTVVVVVVVSSAEARWARRKRVCAARARSLRQGIVIVIACFAERPVPDFRDSVRNVDQPRCLAINAYGKGNRRIMRFFLCILNLVVLLWLMTVLWPDLSIRKRSHLKTICI